MSNQKEVGLQFMLYAGDSNDILPMANAVVGNMYWTWANGLFTTASSVPKIAYCPAADIPASLAKNGSFTYGVKLWNWGSPYEAAAGNPRQENSSSITYSLAKMQTPSAYLLMSDSVCYSGQYAGIPGYNLNDSAYIGMHFLHGEKTNLLFADFHVESANVGRVKSLLALVYAGILPTTFYRQRNYQLSY
jgi:prepilin-type processing-associated H-X9-DG protein